LELSVGGYLHLAGHPDLPTPPEYAPFLGWLTDFCERFLIAHEYGHAISDEMSFSAGYSYRALKWKKELQADTFAYLFTMISAAQLDHIPPNYALQGAFFVFSAFELVRRAIDVVRFGVVQKEKQGFGDHPPTKQRMELLKQLYHREFTTQESKQGPRKGKIRRRTPPPRYSLDIEGALYPSETVDLTRLSYLNSTQIGSF